MKEKKVLSVKDQIELIKSFQKVSDEDIETLFKAYNVEEHEIFSRPPRIPTVTYKNDNGEIVTKDGDPRVLTKIGIPLAEEIVEKAVSFACGNPLDVTFEGGTEALIKEIEQVAHNNKEMSLNRRMCRALFAFREVAEIWYYEEDPETGKGEIRVHLVSPMFADRLYPEIDRRRKMQSFAYSNTFIEDGEEIEELVHYTKEKTVIYRGRSGKWEEYEVKANDFKKITVVYSHQGKADYEKVLSSIYRREKAMSNLGDSVDDTAYPDKVFKGNILGISSKPGESNQYEVDGEGDVKFIESEQGTDLIRLDLEENEAIARRQTQTPDISIDSLKGLGSGLSGEVLRRLLTDAILKVQNKKEYLDEHYQRRYNIIYRMVSHLKGHDSEKLNIYCEVVPYVPKDEETELDRLRKMIDIMPQRYIIKQFKERIDSSIDEEEIMQWIRDEKDFEYGGSLMEE